ncbi:MAG: mycothiol system anti-sigma-R factor [Actinomycetota bacterium]|nr:mycothiol system anti-sigma-R factor [Actinomycetota bacterium]
MDDDTNAEPLGPRVDPGDLAPGDECRKSLSQLYGFLDGELTVERRRLVLLHLDRCHGCEEAYDFEAELRMVVSTCCKEKKLPPGLRDRVAQALRDLSDEH